MKKSLVLALLLAAATAGANNYLTDYAYYPIVSSTNGAGGTRWQTELSVTNPQSFDLVLTVRLARNGSSDEYVLTVPAGRTLVWDDFLATGFSLAGNAAVYLTAEEERNPGRSEECLRFASAAKVYNTGGGSGTYGQEIPQADPLAGFLGSYVGYFSGVKSYGVAGSSGFRTNVGFWHTGFSDETLRLRLYDDLGALVWQGDVTVERHDPKVVSISATVETGVLVVDPMGEYVDCAVYVSVVDNRTGDGAFRSLTKADPDDLTACGVLPKGAGGAAPVGPATREEAAARLHRLVVGE